jgi:mono/diheme cytochrome c family protein
MEWIKWRCFSRKNPIFGEKLMRKSIFLSFWLFGIFLLSFQDSGSIWAQDQAEGKKLYGSYCSTCHGDNGKGDGLASKSLPAKPVDHTNGTVMNQLSDKFLFDIISKGGSAVGKSAFMPGWGSQLNEKQIRDVIAYVRSIADPPYKAPEK